MFHTKLIMRIGDLEKLTEVLSDIEVENVFKEEDKVEIFENALYFIDVYINSNILAFSQPDFMETLIEEIHKMLALQFEHIYDDIIEEELYIIISEACKTYFTHVLPRRSYKNTFTRNILNKSKIKSRLEELRSKPQPDQRTNDWYLRRHNMITASIAWKALDSKSYINSLIYEKCSPIHVEKYSRVNTETPFHWGTKFEPVSIMIYEKKYSTKIDEFGCITDENYDFIGASPDGINVDETSRRFGRMLEVKNRVSEAVPITGIPKKEYWIQMQMQMGACQLNECDFLETKFDPYEDRDEFMKDGNFNESADGKMKGLFMYFIKEGKPHYEYPPIGLSEQEFKLWEEQTIQQHSELTWMKNIYWKLDKISCVLVLRNKEWYKAATEKMTDIWNIIQKERVSGYEHRAPNRRERKKQEIVVEITKPVCLIDVNKLICLQEKKEKKTTQVNNTNNLLDSKIEVIKVNTEV